MIAEHELRGCNPRNEAVDILKYLLSKPSSRNFITSKVFSLHFHLISFFVIPLSGAGSCWTIRASFQVLSKNAQYEFSLEPLLAADVHLDAFVSSIKSTRI